MKNTEKIPFLDLIAPHQELKSQLCEVFETALDTGAFVGGSAVERFERDFAAFCDTRHCIGVSSGTDALRLAIIAAGIEAGSVVLTVPNTFIATAEAISQAGAIPDFIDIHPRTYNMDCDRLEQYLHRECRLDPGSGRLISRRLHRPVAAVIPVHLYGQMADMDRILEIGGHYNLPVIEDACQAHGAEYYSARENRWCKAGSMGKAAAFSFYPGKNLGACGEGGAVTTNDAALAQKVMMLRDHGQSRKYYHEVEGYNGRLHAIQAGFLHVKLRQLDAWNCQRREAARRYLDLLTSAGTPELAVFEPDWSRSVYHLYVIRAENREALMQHLSDENIGTGIHYPVPLHLQNAYKSSGYRSGDFPVTEALAPRIISLPMFPQLTYEQQLRVVSCVRRVSGGMPLAGTVAAGGR
jgi:dTDP-4-amino-4,6-dideoxygalactose transaminase